MSLAKQVEDRLTEHIHTDEAATFADALRAVLTLHKPVSGDPSWCDEDGFTVPCDTVRAIAEALGVTPAGSSP